VRRRIAIAVSLGTILLAACGRSDGEPAAESTIAPGTDLGGGDCVVRLHGKGGSGWPTEVVDDIAYLAPTGNEDGWDDRQWLYFPDERYDEARAIVLDAIDAADCESVVIDGFSNGGAFASKLACRGETFGDRLTGIVIDDPVTDEGVADCAPASDVRLAFYWTGALAEAAPAGTDCRDLDWTCEGDVIIGVDAYTTALGVEVQASPFDDHQWYLDAPEPVVWLDENA
jgi:pimeloyl-ACP methyl ester carboxylesterase